MMRTLLIGLALVAGCKGAEPVVTTPPPAAPARPFWVGSRPVSDAYYVGVGLAAKARPDFQESSKKNALNDLASEISVRVEGNSLLYTLDRKTSFSESFTSNIRTSTSEQLEGFELVDTWENEHEYWTYYRLSKAEHARIKAERKQRAMDQATDLYARARTSLSEGDLKGAVAHDLRALLAIKDYWGESDQVEVEGRQVVLANELYDVLQRTVAGVRIGILPERCALGYDGRFKRELLITARFDGTGTAADLRQLPLVVSYPGSAGKVVEKRNTDGDAQARTLVQRIQLDAINPEVVVRLDMEALVPEDLDNGLAAPLVASLNTPERRVPIDVTMPRVHMQSLEKNFGEAISDGGAALALREELSTKGFRFVDREQDADLLMLVNANTREGGSSNGFYTAYLDISFSFRDRRSREVIYEGGRQGVKGVQLNFTKAGLEAYKKAVQEVRRELAPAMMDAIM